MSRQARIFVALCAVSTAGLSAYIYFAKSRTLGKAAPAPTVAAQAPVPITAPAQTPPEERLAVSAPPSAIELATTTARTDAAASAAVAPSSPDAKSSQIFFRYNGVDGHYGRLAYVSTANLAAPRFVDGLHCEVVHVSGGQGICLTADRGVLTTYAASLFDAKTFAVRATIPLQGIPSRSRVSANGRLAAFTVFVSGHGYTTLDFSTQTLLIDLAADRVLADLEKDFKVIRDGQPFSSPDFNFWGVTFTPDARRFYATLSTGGKHYLIEGDVAQRTARVIHENVECPSLSPDATRVAYKKRFMVSGRVVWQLHVLDLSTKVETPLAERRSIDDQLEWLDDAHVLYTTPESDADATPSTNVWRAAADGSRPPEIFLKKAYSPAVARN